MSAGMRSERGQLVYAMGSLLLTLLLGLAAFAVDVYHYIVAQKELQLAVDAGALAGATQLSLKGNTIATEYALTVTGKNFVENRRVAASPPDCTVSVLTELPTAASPGTVTVTATMKIDCIFSKVFGRTKELVSATATAGGMPPLTMLPAGATFPLAISIDAVADSKKASSNPLSSFKPGELFTIYMGANKDSNAAFTSLSDTEQASGKNLKSQIDECLGVSDTKSEVPAVSVGNNINLTNGDAAFEYLTKDPAYGALLNGQMIYCPIIEGDAPFNKSRPIIGFVALKITSISKEKGLPIIAGNIVKPAISGDSQNFYTGAYSQNVRALSPVVVKLIR